MYDISSLRVKILYYFVLCLASAHLSSYYPLYFSLFYMSRFPLCVFCYLYCFSLCIQLFFSFCVQSLGTIATSWKPSCNKEILYCIAIFRVRV